MRLAREAKGEVQEFFRGYLGDPEFSLPEIKIHGGLFAKLLMKAVGMAAMTLGHHVFVSPSHIRRDEEGRASMPGWLLVHEAAHVLQYEERGHLRFLLDYVRNYWRGLRAGKSWDAAGRMAAYKAIEDEHAAREAADAYRERERERGERNSTAAG